MKSDSQGSAPACRGTFLEKIGLVALDAGTNEDVEKLSEQQLVSRSCKGDKAAYRLLVEKFQERIYAVAYGVLRNREDAEDVAQEAFVKAYLSLKNFRQDSSFYTWLYRIAYNMAIDFKRKVARRGGSAVEWDPEMLSEQVSQTPLLQESERPDESFERGELRSALKFALEELTEPHRVVIVLREVDGMSYDEIADVVGVSKGTVMSRLHYARKRLQEILSESAFGKPVEISGRELHDVR